MSNRKNQNEKGQSLLELLIVIAVAVIVIGALTFATIASLRNAQLAQNQAQATKLAQEGLEKVRAARDRNDPFTPSFTFSSTVTITDWKDTGSVSTSLWLNTINNSCFSKPCFFKFSSGQFGYSAANLETNYVSSAELIPPFFYRYFILSDDSSYTAYKIVTVVVTWKDFAGFHESRLSTYLRKI